MYNQSGLPMPTITAENHLSKDAARNREYNKKTDGFKAFDFTCKHYLKITGEQFLQKYANGDYEGSQEQGVQRAIAMLPFVR